MESYYFGRLGHPCLVAPLHPHPNNHVALTHGVRQPHHPLGLASPCRSPQLGIPPVYQPPGVTVAASLHYTVSGGNQFKIPEHTGRSVWVSLPVEWVGPVGAACCITVQHPSTSPEAPRLQALNVVPPVWICGIHRSGAFVQVYP